MAQRWRVPLYWRVCSINGAVLVAGTAVLAVSPASVSARVLGSEAVVLAVGLTVILTLNALLLRSVLVPMDRLAQHMGSVDLRRPGRRLPEPGPGPVADLIGSFTASLHEVRGRPAPTARSAREPRLLPALAAIATDLSTSSGVHVRRGSRRSCRR